MDRANQKSLTPDHPMVVGLLLAILTVALYLPVKDFDFCGYDDPVYVYENPHVLGGLSPAGIVWAFGSGGAANWHPLSWISLMLDVSVFGPGPSGMHLVNILFHVANTVLLFQLLLRFGGAVWRAAVVAALFAWHPLHVESVAWIAERKDVLSLFFELLALNAYVKAATGSGTARFMPSLVFFACALMSKPMAVTFPCLLLLLDYWPLRRFSLAPVKLPVLKQLVIEKIPFFAMTLAMCVITYLVQKQGGAMATQGDYPPGLRWENALVSYALYLGKMVWPAALATPYPHPSQLPVVAVAGALALLTVISFLAWRMRVSRPYVLIGWCWFLGTLVPVIGIIQVGDQAMADRYSYLPLIGIFIALVWWGADWLVERKLPAAAGVVAAAVVLLGYGWRSHGQLQYWRNDEALFTHTLAVTGDNFAADINLGSWHSRRAELAPALACYLNGLKLRPTNAVALYNVGNIQARMGDQAGAEQHYRAALNSDPTYMKARINLGVVLTDEKRYDEASTNLEAVLNEHPDNADALNNLGTVRFHQGRQEDAAHCFARALELAPGNAIYAMNAGDALVRIGQKEAALECYQHLLELEPDNQAAKAKLDALSRVPSGQGAEPRRR